MEWFRNLIDSLERVLDKPPYLIFFFIGSIFVVISLLFKYSLDLTWAFFIYAVAGTVWRYIERDFVRSMQRDYDTAKAAQQNNLTDKNPKDRGILVWLVITIYHIGNLILLFAFLHHLYFV